MAVPIARERLRSPSPVVAAALAVAVASAPPASAGPRRGGPARAPAAAPQAGGVDEQALLRAVEDGSRRDAQAAAAELHLDYGRWMADCLREAASLRPVLAEAVADGVPAWVVDDSALRGSCRSVLSRKTALAPPQRLDAVYAIILSNIQKVSHPAVLGAKGGATSGAVPPGAAARAAARRLRVEYGSWIAGCEADLAARTEQGRRAGFTYTLPPAYCDTLLARAADGAPQTRRRAIDADLSAVEVQVVRSQAAEQAAAKASAEAALQAQAQRLRVDYGQWIAGCRADMAERLEKGRRKGFVYALSPTTVTAVCGRLLGRVADGGAGARRRAVWAHLDRLEKGEPPLP